LKRCVEQAGLAGVVTCHQLALSSTDGEAFIQLPDGLHSGSAELTRHRGANRIVTRRLDALKLPPPDFIKMDVEGHEAEVLRGGIEAVKAARPFIVFENKRDYSQPEKTLEPLLLLAGLGYRFYVPAVKQAWTGAECLVPCGWQMDLNRIQAVQDHDWFALAPFTPSTRYLLQHDINVFACHESRHPQVLRAFSEWHPAPRATS
jgi:hypothetical protein